MCNSFVYKMMIIKMEKNAYVNENTMLMERSVLQIFYPKLTYTFDEVPLKPKPAIYFSWNLTGCLEYLYGRIKEEDG